MPMGRNQKTESRQFHLAEEMVRVRSHRSVYRLCKVQIHHSTVVRTSGTVLFTKSFPIHFVNN